MSIESLKAKRRNLVRKLQKDNVTVSDLQDVIRFYSDTLLEIQNSVESIPYKDGNVLYVVAIDRVKTILKVAEGLDATQKSQQP